MGTPHALAEEKSFSLTFDGEKSEAVYSGMEKTTPVRLGRLGELLITTALLQSFAAGEASLEEPANFYLNDLQLLQPFGDIQVRHLLSRQSGLPLRQTHLYLTDGNRIPELREFIVQELKPAILPPGNLLTHQSMGDLVPAQILKEVVSQQRNRETPLSEIVNSTFAPLRWQNTAVFKGKTGQQYQDVMQGSATPFSDFPAVWTATPDVHGYTSTPQDLGKLLKALLRSEKPFEPSLRKLLLPTDTEPSLGFFKSTLGDQRFFYLDSTWFGQSLRLAVFPEARSGFVYFSNTRDAGAVQRFTQDFVTQRLEVSSRTPFPSAPESTSRDTYPLRLMTRDRVSLLTALDIVNPVYVHVLSPSALRYRGEHWHLQRDKEYVNATGQRIFWDGEHLHEQSGAQQRWQVSKGFYVPRFQWLIAGFFTLLMAVFAGRGALKLWRYMPQIEGADGVEYEVEYEVEDGVEARPEENWDLPLVSAISASCAAAFAPAFYYGLLGGKVGQELSFVIRNQPTPALIGSLLLPLVALVSGLILSLLLVNEWRERRFSEKAVYGVQLITLLGFLYWLAQWNLLGFRF